MSDTTVDGARPEYWMEKQGVVWHEPAQDEDFQPYLPREEYEPPFLGPDDLTEIEPGMILCVELGCFGSDLIHFGNMPEDMWLVTDSGLELLGVDLPRDIWLCP